MKESKGLRKRERERERECCSMHTCTYVYYGRKHIFRDTIHMRDSRRAVQCIHLQTNTLFECIYSGTQAYSCCLVSRAVSIYIYRYSTHTHPHTHTYTHTHKTHIHTHTHTHSYSLSLSLFFSRALSLSLFLFFLSFSLSLCLFNCLFFSSPTFSRPHAHTKHTPTCTCTHTLIQHT